MAHNFTIGLNKTVFDSLVQVEKANPRGPYLVIYKKDITSLEWFADGYLRAAQVLVWGIHSDTRLKDNDETVFPVMFLLVHALELRLKAYLSRLIMHRQKKSCDCIPAPPSGMAKILNAHALMPIFDATLSLVNHRKLHGNKEYASLKKLIQDIDHYGLSVESLRYETNNKGVHFPLFDKQRFLFVAEALFIFEEAFSFLKRSKYNYDFDFCELKEFKSSLLNEFKWTLVLLKKLKSDTKRLRPRKSAQGPRLLHNFNLKDLATYHKNTQNIEALLKRKSDNDLLLTVRGLRFGKDHPINIPNKEYFKNGGRTAQIKKITEDIRHIDNAIMNIEKHIQYIDDRISMKS